jgi:hypothetical protein
MTPIPLDDLTLDAIEHALGASLTYENGDYDNPIVVGADFTLPKLLDFLAGQDATDGHEEDGMWICHQPSFSQKDLIRALVNEVRELRARVAT